MLAGARVFIATTGGQTLKASWGIAVKCIEKGRCHDASPFHSVFNREGLRCVSEKALQWHYKCIIITRALLRLERTMNLLCH